MNNLSSIGLFDSGVGGLTVYRALRETLPGENFIYLGDTARVPYGSKSPALVTQYALQIAARLYEEDIKLLVVACNTASAAALPELCVRYPNLPILGVIEPGATAAVTASRTGKILVMGTTGTIKSGAYGKAIRQLKPDCEVRGLAANVLVALAEEGWTDGAVVESVIGRYLETVADFAYDTVVLGCTHFPLFAPVFRRLLPTHIAIVDSATTTAHTAYQLLLRHSLLKQTTPPGTTRFFVTDDPEPFNKIAQHILGTCEPVAATRVDDLEPALPAFMVA